MKYLLLLLLVCSCSSAKKKAIELSEKGLHEEAVSYWAEALKKDPDDEEVKNGLQSSLEIVSNDKLTNIRDKRLANQYQVAIDELKALTDLQKKYKLKLDFNSSTFQGKEIHYLWPHYQESINTKVKNDLPLSAEADQRHYQDVFSSMSDWHKVQAKVTKKGVKKCNTLKLTGEDRPFYRSFVTQFCKYWGPERGLSQTTVSSKLFSKIETTTSIKNLDDTSVVALENALNKSLKESPWYHPESHRAIKMKIAGQYISNPQSQTVKQVHNYKVNVPYTDYQMVQRSRQIPYSAVENGVMVTKYRTEYYQNKEPVTRYRTEPRIYEYLATKKTQTLSLNVKGSILFDKNNESFSFMKEETEERFLHDINIPDIGLYPAKTDISSPLVKFNSYSLDAAQKFKADMNSIWQKLFCTLPNDRSMASVGENVIRCQRLESYPEEFVNSWFKNHFGVTAMKARKMIGQF
ncbi:hypothetical protein ACJVC5_12615 [Peredibacter sp. HCB2-198]|uniref:hypothetical protein n=1 Tax=Peredibacter sp. HCB2-198 TaxID=3383025 RepID=UPI0038B60E9C